MPAAVTVEEHCRECGGLEPMLTVLVIIFRTGGWVNVVGVFEPSPMERDDRDR